MINPADCKHSRTQIIAQDSDAQYVECLECGEFLEARELQEPPEFPEPLSGA
jgi:hypothetical protein